MAISANELRIGNIILSDNCMVVVHAVLDTHSSVRTKQGNLITCQHDLANPIPLTPEILEKVGLTEEQNGFQTKFSKMYRPVLVDTKFELTYLDEETYAFIAGNTITHLSHLHQLQNLYYALTGEELTYTP